MTPTLESLGIDRLSIADRIRVAQAILESIAQQSEAPPRLTEAQRQELERRLEDAARNPDDVVDWEQVRAEALARWSK